VKANRFLLLLAAAALSSLALADEASLRRTLEPKLGVQIEGIQAAPVPGLYEVRYRSPQGVQLIYVDESGNYIIQGKIYDLRAERDLTEERLRKLNAIKFESLPLELAVKVQRGNGKRVLAMFSDPYCPACRQFERSLAQVDNVTIYVFMYPVIRPENADHSRKVWCAPDRAKARARPPGCGAGAGFPAPARGSRYIPLASPITCPSGSARSAIVTCGSSVTGMIVLPPSFSAWSRTAWGSSTET